jgi:hypothetical protein
MNFIEAVNRLEYDETQPVSFQYMVDLAAIIRDDYLRVEKMHDEETTSAPEELIPFLP